VVGYNILNEPHPERLFGDCPIASANHQKVQKLSFELNNQIIGAIRTVDPHTPIIIDSSNYADPGAFQCLQPLEDPRIIYAFYMYEPYEYTNHGHNQGQYVYPGISGEVLGSGCVGSIYASGERFSKAI
jgi:hypothetical protein